MAFTINHVVLVGGNLTRDAELKFVSSGTARLTFDIAMNSGYKDKQTDTFKEQVSYFKVVYWGKPAESIKDYMTKGKKVAVEGRLSQRRWQSEDGRNNSIVEVVASNVVLMGGNRDAAGAGPMPGAGASMPAPPMPPDPYGAPPAPAMPQGQPGYGGNIPPAQNFGSDLNDQEVPF